MTPTERAIRDRERRSRSAYQARERRLERQAEQAVELREETTVDEPKKAKS